MTSRLHLLSQLQAAVTGPVFIHAAWLEGSDASGRADEFSDVDLWLDVEPDHEESALQLVRDVVASFGSLTVDDEPVHPDPLIRQRFLGSAGLSPFHFVDVCVQTHGRATQFTAADPYLLWFDHSGVIQHAPQQGVNTALELARLTRRKWRVVLVGKELRRKHTLEALAYYRAEVLTLLVRFLRLRYCPARLEYGLKHVAHDLPPEALHRLTELHSLSHPDDLRWGVEAALNWMEQLKQEVREKR